MNERKTSMARLNSSDVVYNGDIVTDYHFFAGFPNKQL